MAVGLEGCVYSTNYLSQLPKLEAMQARNKETAHFPSFKMTRTAQHNLRPDNSKTFLKFEPN